MIGIITFVTSEQHSKSKVTETRRLLIYPDHLSLNEEAEGYEEE